MRERFYKMPVSAEEFYNFIDQLLEREDSDSPYQVIADSEKIYHKSKTADISINEKKLYKDYYLNKLVDLGYRFKGMWEDAGNTALNYFQKALIIDRKLPIAHYRIGHILYKRGRYAEAVTHFEKAIEFADGYKKSKFGLADFQEANARKIISFCALKLFEKFKDGVLENESYPELNSLIESYIAYLEEECTAYAVVVESVSNNQTEVRQVSYDEYLEIKEETDCSLSSMYLDAYAREPCAGFNGREVKISIDSLLLLRDLIKGEPIEISDYIRPRNRYGVMRANTFNQRLARLREKLAELGLTPDKFEIINPRTDRAYVSTNLKVIMFKRIEE
ncbi:Tetratricopeptide repeat protein [Sporotomaculum syntrophicum]|uniref:Tetratricopeptide repeat protein n=1 Tax=Sporotomaculum syntrophicum TaxID=182264 RepID=A0A9D3AWK7_9FIRM|nr:tetratricopeptide repeat protein [Sporotomaculum syntrophicum]KAF1085555.1 Tetratricopeptide repeat protein [Sporotomaculum syntrophicum]